MDEYLIVPKHVMDQQLAQIQINKEPPEAREIVNLDAYTSKILHRKDISEWEKADMLAASLERFLALRPKATGETSNPVYSPSCTDDLARKPMKKEPPIVELSDDDMDIDDVNKVQRKKRRTKESAMKPISGTKRKAEFDDGRAKVRAIGIPDDLMSEDGEYSSSPNKLRTVRKFAPRGVHGNKFGEKRKAKSGPNHVKRTALSPNDEIVTDDESPQIIQELQLDATRGAKRKAKRDHRINKIRRIGTSEDILTEDEGLPLPQVKPSDSPREVKRKAKGVRRIRKTRRIGIPENVVAEKEENHGTPKRRRAVRKLPPPEWKDQPVVQKRRLFPPVDRLKKMKVHRGLKRKFEEVDDNGLRKRQQSGSGRKSWIRIY